MLARYRVHEATVSGVAYFDAAATTALRQLPSPFAYLDFETIGFSVPEIIGTRPDEQLPFQWSVHVMDAVGSGLVSKISFSRGTHVRRRPSVIQKGRVFWHFKIYDHLCEIAISDIREVPHEGEFP
jgi:hypothetical protein